MLYNVDDFIRTQIDTQIDYVQSDVYLYDGQIDTPVSSTTASQRRYVADADWLF